MRAQGILTQFGLVRTNSDMQCPGRSHNYRANRLPHAQPFPGSPLLVGNALDGSSCQIVAEFSRPSRHRGCRSPALLLRPRGVRVEDADSRFAWANPAILSSLIIGAALFVAFVIWERFVGRKSSAQDPVFPLRLMKERVFAALIVLVFSLSFSKYPLCSFRFA